MSPERWQQVKSTLAAALACESTRTRTEFLERTCGDDEALRVEVQSLLDQPTDAFDAIAQTIGLANPEPFPFSLAGRRLGSYELVQELGRGGMGAVWLARRADRQFEKLVAIKLLKRGTDTDEVLRRFHAERQILARLDHPNISRLLDAGMTDDGLPYFVMEYVEGRRVTDFVSGERLPLRARLQLFLKICAAVQFAHQNLVIHRDLKPGNILVTAAGEPKLLDFGVARLLAPGDEAWQLTLPGEERFTPGYASPEQIRGEPITTVSDVYSLGGVLYEILTGTPPHRLTSKTPTTTEVSRILAETEPVRPSLAADDPELRRQLRGDLDTILLRALAIEPLRRYRGAGQLADDLRRYLDDRPVRARPDTLAYRGGKFLRRNKALTAAAALVFLSLLAGFIATARQAQIANRERARAEHRFNELRQIANSLMLELHGAIADLPGALAARQLVTQRAVQYLDSLAQEAGDDLALKSELATAYEKVGNLTFDLHSALALREKAAALAENLVQAAPQNAAYRMQLSEGYEQLSDAMKIAGHSQRAIDYARKSLAVLSLLADARPAPAELATTLADRQAGLAIVLADAGDFRGALQAALLARPTYEKLLAAQPNDFSIRRKLEAADALMADAQRDAGNSAEAKDYARQAFGIAQEIFSAEPANSGSQRDMWAGHFRLGRQLAADGDATGASEHYRRAIEFMETLASADPKDTGHRRWLAVTYSALGDAQAAQAQRTEAFRWQEKALAISQELTRDDPERVEAERDTAKIYRSLGALSLENGDARRAAQSYERAVSIAEKLLANDPANARTRAALAGAQVGLAASLRRMAEPADSSSARASNLRMAGELREKCLRAFQELDAQGMLTAKDAAQVAQIETEP